MFGSSWRIARVAGIDVRIDSSWAVIALLVGFSFYARIVTLHEGTEGAPAVALAVTFALLFFLSVLVHEFAHALVARGRGVPIEGITLFLFGGVTQTKLESRRASDEFAISIVGPLTSLGLAAVFWGLSALGDGMLHESVASELGYLGWINLALGVFNLLPGFPLDGGRVLRAVVWGVTGSLERATKVAGTGGRVVGWLLIAVGLLQLATGNLVGGLWIAFIGWFLAQAAQFSQVQSQARRLMEGAVAADVMESSLVTVPVGITVQQAVDDYFMRHNHSAFPVVEDDRTIGLLTLRGVKKLDRATWPSLPVRQAMVALADAATAAPQSPLGTVVGQLESEEVHRVLVVEDSRVVGIITSADVTRWLRRREELGPPGGASRPGTTDPRGPSRGAVGRS